MYTPSHQIMGQLVLFTWLHCKLAYKACFPPLSAPQLYIPRTAGHPPLLLTHKAINVITKNAQRCN